MGTCEMEGTLLRSVSPCLLSHVARFIPIVGVGKDRAHINWSMTMQRQHPLLELP